jgi:DNA-binding response OmpR family regulator
MQSSTIGKTRILIVDDDRGISSMAKRYLERAQGYIVREENLSERALAAATEFRPHVILLDWKMPILNGGDVIALLSAQPDLCHIPTLIITSYGDRVRKLGRPVLEKPFSWPTLLACIGNALVQPAMAA